MAQWSLFPATGSFNNGANWDTGSVPTDIASFGSSFGTTISIGLPSTLDTFDFLSDAPAYTFNFDANLTLQGSGFVYEAGATAASFKLGAGTTLTLDNDSDETVSNLSGPGALTKGGVGVLTLTSTDTYTGGTTVLAGTLVGNVAGDVVDDGTVILSASYKGNLSGNGTLAIAQTAQISVPSSSLASFQGSIVVDGDLTVSGTGVETIVNPVSISGALYLGSLTISGAIAGSGRVIIAPFTTSYLTGRNDYTGGTTLEEGSQIVGTTDSLQGDINDPPPGPAGSHGDIEFSQDFDGTFAGTISGDASVGFGGSGMITLTGNNSYSAGTTVSGGILKLGAGGSLGPGSLTLEGGTLDFGGQSQTLGQVSGSGNLRLEDGMLTAEVTTSAGMFLSGFGVVKGAFDGTGTLTATGGVLEMADLFFDATAASTVLIDSAAGTVLKFDCAVGTSSVHPVVTFEGGTTLLDLSSTTLANFHALIAGFAAGEGIEVADATSVSLDMSGHFLTVFDAAHNSLGQLIFSTSYSGDAFVVAGQTISVQTSNGLDYSSAAGGVYTDLAAQFTEHAPAGQGWSGGPGSVTPVSTDYFTGIQNVTGTSLADLLVGGTSSGTLDGGAGNDLIYGNTSQTTANNKSQLGLDGGTGNNALYGSSGDNTFMAGDAEGGFNQIWGAASKMIGVSGYTNNTLSFAATPNGKSVYVDLLNGHNAYVNSGPQNNGTYTLEDSISNVPNVTGSSGADVVIADNGTDRLQGAAGGDQLYAGTGFDTFVYTAYGDSNLVSGYDTLYGFEAGIDKIDLSALHSNASHLLIQTSGTANAVYVEATPGSFNPTTDLAINVFTKALGGLHASDFLF